MSKKKVAPRGPPAKKKKPARRVTRVDTEKQTESLPEDPRPDLQQPHGGPGRMGKPPKLFIRDKYVPWGRALARRGLRKTDIATKMRIGKTKLYEWARDYPEFREALEAGKDEAAAMVENALFERAIGFDVEESRIIGRPQLGNDPKDTATYRKPLPGPDGKPVIVPEKVERVKKRIVGDVQAQQFFLRTQKPDTWNKPIEISGKGGEPLVPKSTIMTVLGTEEFRKYDAAVRAKLAAAAPLTEAQR